MYSLDCPYFNKSFNTLDELLEYVIESGQDPNYNITYNGDSTIEQLIDLIQF